MTIYFVLHYFVISIVCRSFPRLRKCFSRQLALSCKKVNFLSDYAELCVATREVSLNWLFSKDSHFLTLPGKRMTRQHG